MDPAGVFEFQKFRDLRQVAAEPLGIEFQLVAQPALRLDRAGATS
jgi:hypothetical protein